MPQEQYFVEVILKARRRKTGTQKIGTRPVGKFDIKSNAWEYLVHWAGWPDSDNSYEPANNLVGCTRLLEEFWEAAGQEGFLTNVVDFEIDAPEKWIEKERNYFWTHHTVDEVQGQNNNPKQKHAIGSISKPRTPKQPIPSPSRTRRVVESSPRTPSPSPKKSYFSETKPTYDSGDESSTEGGSHETPTKMPKLRILGPRPPTPGRSALQYTIDFDAAPTPEPGVSTDEPMAEAPPASSNGGPPSPPPSPPTRRSGGIKFVENIGLENPVMSTKSRLAKAPIAQGIPRASPVPVPPPKNAPAPASAPVSEDDAMDVDLVPTLVPDANVDERVDDADELGPMLASMEPFNEDGIGGAGFYDSNEDRYAGCGLPKNGDPYGASANDNAAFDVDMPDTAFSVDEFLTTVPIPKDVNKPDADDYRPNRPINDEPVSFGKWIWAGRVTMTVNAIARTLCERATVTDATEADTPRLASFILSRNPLELTALFDIQDIRAFLPAFKPHQYARLFAEGADGENLAVFSEFMARKQQAVLLPALWDEKLIGCLLFISSSSRYFLQEVATPKELYVDTPCLVAILFVGNSDVPAIQDHYKHVLPPMERTVERAVLSPEQWRKSIREEKRYHTALHIIQLPVHVREFVYSHPSTVWCKIPDGDADEREDHQTQLLRHILRKSKAGSVAPEDLPAETHTVFVHVGALRNIHNLPHLMQRRLRPDVRFCLYGAHETVHPSRWGFREIYLLGGIVTFTPEALVDDAWAVLRTIRNINAHPLWTCYLLPQVLGLAHELIETRSNETAEYRDSLPYTLDQIFKTIEKGQVSLMPTPANDPSDEQISRWVVDRVLLRPQTTQAVLDCCIEAFEEAYASAPAASWSTIAKNDVLADMRRVQVQPIFVHQYRRFVVLDSSSDLSRYKPVDGIECTPVGNFTFGDDFNRESGC
ncbi:hypothetical protein B0H16DRAFT_1493982 [Mycena metata]|uniref:Chromo domain-containing protein n=1 Tax=Mycena metata TaxID=1033252 RepID=A0AAD7KBZ8_9AGAR|nr:hypothetical protein B0H16DRAFT_1493982 [Mycena metata]